MMKVTEALDTGPDETEPVDVVAAVGRQDVTPVEAAPQAGEAARGRVLSPLWMAQYRTALVTFDLCAIVLAATFGYLLRFSRDENATASSNYMVIGAVLATGWLIALLAADAYEVKHLASGPEEVKRVLRASAMTVGVLAVVCYATKTDVARGYVVGVVPLGVLLILIERLVVRRYVQSRRDAGAWMHRILAVGTSDSVRHLLETTTRARGAGLLVVGACVEDAEVGSEIAPGVPVVGGVRGAADTANRLDVDVVAVTGYGLGPVGVRELGWQLEGTGRGLVVAPSLTQVAGTRVHVSPVEGLPLVWLEQPQLGRLPQFIKRAMDISGGVFLLVAASPVLLATAAAIKLTSRGPVLFKQARLGINGDEFTILKLRSMYADAERRREVILGLNEQDGGGVLFKIREDPRITPVGKWIRRFSIDELPQILHVLSGRMSLVGPRPLAAADSTYTGHARRRLLMRPGLTGLWQVSGRSDTSWEDAVRLDLYYVENWSPAFDIGILFRTIFTVVARRGAY